MRRRRRKRAAELTPLLDVLFILLFASLIQARQVAESDRAAMRVQAQGPAGAVGAAAGAPVAADAAPPRGSADGGEARDGGPQDSGDGEVPSPYQMRSRQVASLVAGSVRSGDVFVVEVAQAGYVEGISRWRDGALLQRDDVRHRLLREVPPEESFAEIAYRGDTRPVHRICRIALASVDPARPDLDRALVVITTDAPLADLNRALRDGLEDDAGRCFNDAMGIAILIDPRREMYEFDKRASP